jgi:beta-glucanase (GH16 family)
MTVTPGPVVQLYFGLWLCLLGCSAPTEKERTDADRDTATSGPANPEDSPPENDSASPTTPPTDSGAPSEPDPSDETDTAIDSGSAEPGPLDNLLRDESFERGDDAWNIWGGAQRIEDHAHAGAWALRATNNNGAEQRVVELEPNTTYRLSGWGKTLDSTPMTIGVKDYGGAESRVVFETADYTEAGLSFTTGFAYTTATIYAYKYDGDAEGYADTLSLTYEGPSPYTLVWSDEFDGAGAPDDTKWQFEEGFVRNEELQWYQPDNATQEGGMLVIEGREEDRPNPSYVPGSSDWRTARETIEHTSSSITTRDRFSWQYGHLVVRAKVTNLTGTWPAIWTLGTDCEWPSNGEVDVMENYGGHLLANFAWGTDHRWSPEWDSSHWPVSDLGAGWTDDFHLWELDWNETQMTIRLDGAVLNTVSLADTINGSAACTGENPFQQHHFLLLNLALGGSAGGSVAGLVFPTQYWVDYVRVYQ